MTERAIESVSLSLTRFPVCTCLDRLPSKPPTNQSQTDAQIMRVLEALDALALTNSTLVLAHGDHGKFVCEAASGQLLDPSISQQRS